MILYRLIFSDRRTMSLSLEKDGSVTVRAPRRLPQAEIDRFVLSHASWIETHRERQRRRAEFEAENFSPEQLARLTEQAREILPARTEMWGARMGLTPTGIRITQARTRFGSCSPKNAICFSARLMAYPDDAIDYVIVHELAHIREKNHSARFYALVARYLPDWRRREAMLRHREEME